MSRPAITKKAKAAIYTYVEINLPLRNLESPIHYTLKADRMPREKLYAYLECRGYRWNTGFWHKPSKTRMRKIQHQEKN